MSHLARTLYFDDAATTPVAPEVLAQMLTVLSGGNGDANPSSTHILDKPPPPWWTSPALQSPPIPDSRLCRSGRFCTAAMTGQRQARYFDSMKRV